MNRRGFLSLLGAGAAALALDPERALWVPGKKLISIPKVTATNAFAYLENGHIFYRFEFDEADLDLFQSRYIEPAVKALVNHFDAIIFRNYQAIGANFFRVTELHRNTPDHPYLDFSLHNSRPLRCPWDTNPPKTLA